VTASTRFIFNKSTGSLSFDIDGSGSTAAIQIASLTTNLNLTEDNIFVG
jgi:Ca2+-binding RTX toxin-like protein